MKTPIISVLLPVHNGQKYLLEAINSILNQTERDFEFIIINDGSTDLTGSLLQEIEKKEKRITIINGKEKQGLTIALNIGIAHAKGKYIARMDADDMALPERFSKQLEFLENNPEFVIVGCCTLLIDPEGLPICLFSQKTSHKEIDADHMAGKGGAICHPASMIRKNALEKIGGYRQTMKNAEDLDLFLRLAEIGQIGNLPEILFKWRMHFHSVGHTYRESQRKSAKKAVLAAFSRRGLQPTTLPGLEEMEESSIADVHRKWAWWALKAGNTKTSRKHAISALKNHPFSYENWKVFGCSLRGN